MTSLCWPNNPRRCLSVILAQPEGRALVRKHRHFLTLLSGLKAQAQQQASRLIRQLSSAATATSVFETAAAPTAAQEEAGPSKGKKGANKGRGKKAGKEAAAGEGAAAGAGAGAASLVEDAVSSVALFCKAALHMALMGALYPPEDAEDEEGGAGEEDAAATMQHAALAMMEAQDMCQQVVEACNSLCASADDSNEAAGASARCCAQQRAALGAGLRFATDVLGVLGDGQHLSVLDLTHGGQLEQVRLTMKGA